MMTIALLILGYLIVGAFFAIFTAQVVNEKNRLQGGRNKGWNDEFATALLVITMPFVWPLAPVGFGLWKLGTLAGHGATGIAKWGAKEIVNPKGNVPEA